MEKLLTTHVDTRSRLPLFFYQYIKDLCAQLSMSFTCLELVSSRGNFVYKIHSYLDLFSIPHSVYLCFDNYGKFLKAFDLCDDESPLKDIV